MKLDMRYLAKGILKVDPDSKTYGGDLCPFCGDRELPKFISEIMS